MIRGILFDKDGTLLDFYATWLPIYLSAARRLCLDYKRSPQDVPQILAAAGYGPSTQTFAAGSALACGAAIDIARVWAPILGEEDVLGLCARLDGYFYRDIQAEQRPVDGLVRTITKLHRAGFTLGLATMDSARSAAAFVELFALSERFQYVVGSDSGVGQKPQAGMVEAFCAACGLSPAQLAVVGDTPHDMNMGRAAGVGAVIGVLTGAGDFDTLSVTADVVLDSVAQLPAYLRAANGAAAGSADELA